MNILIVGFGSIGQRHLKNLIDNYPDNKYFVFKKTDKNEVIQDCKIIENQTIKSFYSGVKFFKNLNDIDLKMLDAAFICNDSSKHLDIAFTLLENNIDMFIEKPIDSDFDKVLKFQDLLSRKKSIVMIGYQMRFHPVYEKIREVFLGIKNDINYLEIKWANYLPSFHEYEDYRKRYAARADLGGGVLLTLSHEINILNSFFDEISVVASMEGFSKGFSLDVEDHIFALLKSGNVKINLSLGFSQVFEERYIKIQTNNQYIVGDFISNKIRVFNSNGTDKEFNFSLKRNELFMSEVDCFFNCIKTREINLNTVEESLKDLLLINEIKAYSEF